MWTARRRNEKHRQGRQGLLGALALSVLLSGCSISDLLEVDLPGVVKSTDLDSPGLASTLVDGVIGDFECAYSNFTAVTGHLAGEWTISGTAFSQGLLRNVPADDRTNGVGNCLQFYGMFTPIHTARFQSETVYDFLEGFDVADVPDKVEMQGVVRAYGGHALLMLGEAYCSATIDAGPELTRADVYTLAVTKFDEAITILGSTSNTSVLNMARVGRARANVDLQNWSAALADASAVPPGFIHVVQRENVQFERLNKYVRFFNEPGGLWGTIANDYRDLRIMADGTPTAYCDALGISPAAPCDGPEGAPFAAGDVADPRVDVFDSGLLGRDNVSPVYMHTKYTSLDDDIPLASYEEAQLYVAEAEAQLGNLDDALTAINGLRTALSLPTYAIPTTLTQVEVIDAVLEERRRELFQQSAAHFNDMVRYRGTVHDIPFNGEPGSIHPNGTAATGATYGSTTCFLLPLVERNVNPNVS